MRTLLLAVLLFCTGVWAEVDDGSVLHSGEATFYGDGGGGNCGFPGELQPLYHGALNHTDYDSAAACGTWVRITGPDGEVAAFIDDRCPECKPGDIDLGPGTFEQIADRALGRVPITWRYIEAPVDGPVTYYWQQGSSAYHVAVQIRNHRYGITGVTIKTMDGEWMDLTRSNDNFFFRYGGLEGAAGPYILKVADIFGRVLVDTVSAILPDSSVEGGSNFPVISSGATRQSALSVGGRRHQGSVRVMFSDFGRRRMWSDGPVEMFTLQGRRAARETSGKSSEENAGKVANGIYIARIRIKTGKKAD